MPARMLSFPIALLVINVQVLLTLAVVSELKRFIHMLESLAIEIK